MSYHYPDRWMLELPVMSLKLLIVSFTQMPSTTYIRYMLQGEIRQVTFFNRFNHNFFLKSYYRAFCQFYFNLYTLFKDKQYSISYYYWCRANISNKIQLNTPNYQLSHFTVVVKKLNVNNTFPSLFFHLFYIITVNLFLIFIAALPF